MRDHEILRNFTTIVQKRTQAWSLFKVKVICEWDLHGLMNQVVPFFEPLVCQMTYKYANGSINIEKTLKYKSALAVRH
jgi:hypothetical protein